MAIEGRLGFQLYCQAGCVEAVEIDSSRPFHAPRMFIGKTPNEVMATLPLLYHICGCAQQMAAVMAIEAAQGITVNATTQAAREMLVELETAREHLWRIELDWAEQLGQPRETTAVACLQQGQMRLRELLFAQGGAFTPGAQVMQAGDEVEALIQQLEQWLEARIFAMPASDWLALTEDEALHQWWQSAPTLAARMLACEADEADERVVRRIASLPELPDEQLHRRFQAQDAEQFIRTPQWQGTCCETGAMSRQMSHPLVATALQRFGNGVWVRLLARLVELALVPQVLRRRLELLHDVEAGDAVGRANVLPFPASPRGHRHTGVVTGLAQVEAARGRLIHRVEMGQGVISRYQILAPTEWNFHPHGVAAHLLTGLRASDEASLRQRVERVIKAIDPCVDYEVRLHHA